MAGVSEAGRLFDGGGDTGALMRTTDWGATPLGDAATWPQSLRTVVRIMLTSRYAMWIGWGPDLTFLYNDAYSRMTLAGKHPWALGRPTREVWAEIWEELKPRIDTVLSNGEATFDEALLLFLERHGYSEETYHTFSYSPLTDDAGHVAGNFCVVTEETERVIGERRLGALRLLAAALAAAKTEVDVFAGVEAAIAADPRDIPFSLIYTFSMADASAERAARTGIAGDHAAAGPVFAADNTIWPFADLLAGSGAVTIDTSRVPQPLPAGPWQKPPAQALVLPITPQGHGRPAAAFVVGLNPYRQLDAAYRSFLELFAGQIAAGLANARAYAEERRRADALAAVDRAKTVFFSNVSHEFRTPLTLMLGPTQDALAAGGALTGPELDMVYRNQLRLLKLVNSLLDFSRAEAGRTQATYHAVDLATLTADLASTFRSAVERAGLRLDVDCPPLPAPVFVDPQMWEKIVLNLLSNAFKFTFDGGIRVALRGGADGATLIVEDTGVGIPQHELPRIFERFHRIEGSRSRTHEGSGIGLALVRDLIALHGGAIDVSSRPNHGTTFRVTVPAGSAHLPAEQLGRSTTLVSGPGVASAFVAEAERWQDGGGAPAAAEAVPHAAGGERARIVLADDNADMRDYVRRLLGERWDVVAARDGRAALGAIRDGGADLVITDVMMPEVDGFALLKAIRGDASTRDIPVLVLSARAGEEMRLEGLQAGADDYLVKPFSARELLARVEVLMLRASIRAVENLQRRQLADIFRQAPAAIAILRGPEHVFEHANPAYLELIGDRNVVGVPARTALPELAGQGLFELLDDVFQTGRAHVGKALRLMVNRAGDGSPVECFFDFVYQPMRDATGAIDGIAVLIFEVSELARARREAETASRTKDEFLAMLGHELRNPLAPIQTALQLMRLRGGPALEHERTVIERQTRHLVRLVDDLLDVSRIARGKIELRRERLDAADAVAKAIEMASPLLEERSHRLHVDVPRGLTVNADPARLAQIVANLLTNAAKYTETGGNISIAAAPDGEAIVLRVSDTGIGMDSEMLPRVFDMFTQETQSLDRARGGLGLGLTIVRNLTELHGGTAEARSEGRGKGSEFVIRLPAADPVLSAGMAPDIGAAPASAVPAAGGVAVLIVDDNADAAQMLAQYVATLGYRVEAALDGPAALAAADRVRPEVALLDIGLPVMDGYEVARRLRASNEHAGIRLVAITGYGQEADRQRTQAAGFDAHLVKPVDLDALELLLSRLTNASGAQSSSPPRR
jgi:signal transduction histidine kinase